MKEKYRRSEIYSVLIYILLQQFHGLEKLEMNGFVARSCLDYLQHGLYENGFYWLFDDANQRFVAYCDLTSEPGAAWTLVMSWSLRFKNLPQFRSKVLPQDAPINHRTPNWYSYRQTLARMKSIQSRSTFWRATCSFNQFGVDYRDYIRGKFSQFNIMTWTGHSTCHPVDYISIRDHSAGAGTTAQFWQVKDTYTLTIDSSSARCEFKPNGGAVPSEDNFGFYDTINRNFRCTMTDDSTTQWWFGSYLAEQ